MTSAFAVRVANHFLDRLHERFPEARLTEGSLQRELARAEWYPAGGDHAYYVLMRVGTRRAALVVRYEEGLAELVTLYEPRAGWDKRLTGARAWPFAWVAAVAA